MSWHIHLTGRPEKIKEQLEVYRIGLNGVSRVEFNLVIGPLSALVSQFIGDELIQLSALGHTFYSNGEAAHRTVQVSIKPIAGDLAL